MKIKSLVFFTFVFLFITTFSFADDMVLGILSKDKELTPREVEIQNLIIDTIRKWSSPLAGPSALFIVPKIELQTTTENSESKEAAESELSDAETPVTPDGGEMQPASEPKPTSDSNPTPTRYKLFLEDGSELPQSEWESIERFWILTKLEVTVQKSLNQFYYTTIQMDFFVKEKKEQSVTVRVAGFDENEENSFRKATEEIPKQLLSQLIGLEDDLSGVRVVEILNKNEIVVNLGKKDGVHLGSTFSLYKYLPMQEGETEKGQKNFGQIEAFKVIEDFTYCRILYVEDELLVGDYAKLDKRAGLSTQIRGGMLASLNKQSDLDTIGFQMSSGAAQTDKQAGAFSEFVGFIGVREIIDYGTCWLRPFFGLDLFLDAAKGSTTGELSAEQLYLVGNIEGESFAFRESFTGLLRPYVGFQMELNFNRVALVPFLSAGMIFNERYSFNSEKGAEYLPASGNSYEKIKGTGFNYFTMETGLDVEVRIDNRFSFLFNAGYQGWIGNLIDLKPTLSKQMGSEETKLLRNDDFLKFYDWHYLTLGLGLSITY